MSQQPNQPTFSPAKPWRVWLGKAVQAASIVAVILSLIGGGVGPFLINRLARSTGTVLANGVQEITRAADTLRRIRIAVDEGDQALRAAAETIRRLEIALDESEPVLVSTTVLLSETAPEMIEETRESLLAAQEGAQAVDQVLRALGTVSFITGIEYDPENSLDEGISDAAQGLETLPEDLRAVGGDLAGMKEGLSGFTNILAGLEGSVEEVSGQLASEQEALVQLAVRLDLIAQVLEQQSRWIQPAATTLTVFWELICIWIILTQLAVFFVGGRMQEPILQEGS